jgi:2-C-methyl-D-erythritol 4-phosphate cytidylyltransferase/2-C-methyl-D-erythritol 2,4-cyclodiphosphate synthase
MSFDKIGSNATAAQSMTAPHPKTAAVIVAGGLGLRAGGDLPKQFRPLRGRPLLEWSLSAFADHPAISAIVLVLPQGNAAGWTAPRGSWKLLAAVEGGAARQASVRNGLEALEAHRPDRVLIHDAARPLLSPALIGRVLAALDTAPAAIPALKVRDTLKRVDGTRIAGTVDRTGLYGAQTPQGFHFAPILAAHRHFARQAMTDDAAIAEAAGLPVALVAGEPRNIKITQAEDFTLAEALMQGQAGATASITVTGQGFDVHRLVPGDGVWLCGVKIPAPFSLLGHSDADCGLHALTDAVLGAIGAGDIGVHFPPSDARWRGAASDQFLAHALELVRAAGGTLAHVDVTLICERPRIAPHREAMRARLAEITGLALPRVSVKATTTEGLGFAGRGEGIAAQAIATVVLP